MLGDGTVMFADAETYDMYATTGGYGSLGHLIVATEGAILMEGAFPPMPRGGATDGPR